MTTPKEWHGTTKGYDSGCRCSLCTAALKLERTLNTIGRARKRQTPRAVAPEPIPEPAPVPVERWHGRLTGYKTHRCRCDDCKAAGREYRQQHQQQRAPKVAEPTLAAETLILGDRSWTIDALCAETDPEAFFPEKGGSTREAKRICMRCTVRQPCRDEALETRDRYGIRGGLSERERRKLLRRTGHAA